MSVHISRVSHSQQLRAKIQLVLPQMNATSRALTGHPSIAEVIPDYMFTMHCMIRASVPLMRAARAASEERAVDDPVASAMAPYLAKHIREELHHDEWLLDDLELLGFDRAAVLQRAPAPTVADMVGSQYYWIFHHHPVALLGYIAVMEGYPPTVNQVDDLIAMSGYPRDAFRTLLLHAQLDPRHRDDLDELLDALPLEPAHASLMGVSALRTLDLGCSAIHDVLERHRHGGERSSPGGRG